MKTILQFLLMKKILRRKAMKHNGMHVPGPLQSINSGRVRSTIGIEHSMEYNVVKIDVI